ncbi:MAG: helix-turn-helix transcriptional regulator [Deltaproteobacteria bacterium]|nr:helix-turn-helix transcriptional regulator [Deltaproteobacteria bacterium]
MKLKELRLKLNLSQQKFADLLGVNKMSIYYIEKGKRKMSVKVAVRAIEAAKSKNINLTLNNFYEELNR